MKKNVDNFERCCCCEAPAKFDAGSSPCCGRHLAQMVKMAAAFCGGTCNVSVRK